MTPNPSRIVAVTALPDQTLAIDWTDGTHSSVYVGGWIATAGVPVIAELADPALFAAPAVGHAGTAVVWGDEDRCIDSYHLRLLEAAQRSMSSDDLRQWQQEMNLSNQESADALHVALSTYNNWIAGAPVPFSVAVTCRAMKADPILLSAHYRPRKAGRPRKRPSQAA